MSFIRTGLRELGLKVRRQRTRLALRHEKRLLQKSEINLGREGTSQAGNFPELRNEIVALKKLEQEQKEVALRIAQIEEGIKKIEADRQRNSQEQAEALAKLETEKKPIADRRDEASRWAAVCDHELSGVDKRIESNDAADRDLLKQLADLQAAMPPPADLETRSTAIGTRRARLPEERAELVRARLGSADACRLAKEKLIAAEAELADIQKTIDRVRGEYEARDKTSAENIKSQQDEVKAARAQIQTVEERKNPAYLNIGRHLASQGIAPPNAPHLLSEVNRHRAAVQRHLQHTEELGLLSSQVDKQELRKFYFSAVSVLFLLAIILPLVFQSPRRHAWLPQESEAVLALNVEQFERDELPKRWRREQPDEWVKVWTGLVAGASQAPALNLSRDAVRIIRAVTNTDEGRLREFTLIETRGDVTPVIRSLAADKSFHQRTIGGLAVWEKPNLAAARVGPTTVAVGTSTEVDELVQVRLGLQRDLKVTGPLFDRFQTLERDGTVRLLSRDPTDLGRVFHPILPRELLEASQALGFTITLQNPARGRLLIKTHSVERATQLARGLHDEPQRWLRVPDSDLFVFAQPPDVSRQNETLELRFNIPENSARLLLQRLAKTDTPPVVTAQSNGTE